ncbi:EamA domain-containing membrane protein RarD [Tistlia consotensis]|uniref:EamA domain-containing membrane protein RarD n=1 Tax=Tistlia consotensis USBA 355 TaxID=560819 RepID=A0A1Y6CY51_9PROT|nr:EamA domain-containing membrane protein RarD [Tistlia consotensis USBA 355]SNS36305.1 EamA domain-containing membrane protein RarD [Tistlia consotensis]
MPKDHDTAAARQRYGFWVTLAGVLALCPDTLLVRLIATDAWTLMFWRGLLMGIGLLVFFAAGEGPGWLARLLRIGWPGVAAALMFATNAICFVLALDNTTVANTLLIVATSPFFSALLSWIFLGERISLRTTLAILVACAGIATIFSGSLVGADHAGSLWGDLSALCTAVGMAGGFVLVRRHRRVNMVPAMALGDLIACLVALPLASPLALDGSQFGLTLIMGLLLLPVAFGLITIGPRYIPAPEVGLMMLLETVLGPLLVWAVVGEASSPEALIGGAVVVGTLAVHALIGLRQASRAAARAAAAPTAAPGRVARRPAELRAEQSGQHAL